MAGVDLPIKYDSARRGSAILEELRDIYRYRYLIVQLVRRDVLTRYKRSVLGVAWTMLNPLGTMLVLTIAFSNVFGGTRSYAAYVLSGLLAWTFFAQTTNAAISNLVWGGSLLKRIYIPRTIFSVSAIGTGFVNLILSIIPLLIVLIATKVPITPALIFLPVPMFFLALFALGVGLLVSTIAINFADVAEMYQIILPAWMYLSPVIYTVDKLPVRFQGLVTNLNPMYHLITLFRTPIYDGVLPGGTEILISAGISVFMLVLGWLFFTKSADEFAYRI